MVRNGVEGTPGETSTYSDCGPVHSPGRSDGPEPDYEALPVTDSIAAAHFPAVNGPRSPYPFVNVKGLRQRERDYFFSCQTIETTCAVVRQHQQGVAIACCIGDRCKPCAFSASGAQSLKWPRRIGVVRAGLAGLMPRAMTFEGVDCLFIICKSKAPPGRL